MYSSSWKLTTDVALSIYMLMEIILLCIKYNNSFLLGKPQKPKQTFWPIHYFYFFWSIVKPGVCFPSSKILFILSEGHISPQGGRDRQYSVLLTQNSVSWDYLLTVNLGHYLFIHWMSFFFSPHIGHLKYITTFALSIQ